ncbi:MAG: hypothetical protein LBE38_03860 [Deltaproteobacteria bacterium]|nr:hypothetical protein [Deltaproteobacteria bacterium]
MDLPLKVIIFQSILEFVLLILLLLVLWRTGKKSNQKDSPNAASMPAELQNTMERFLSESNKLAQVFSKNLEDKKNLTSDLILKLDKRLKGYRQLLTETETSFTKAVNELKDLKEDKAAQKYLAVPSAVLEDHANPAAPEVRTLVLKLAKEGKSVEDIAVRSKLNRGEVELIIELEGQFNI